MRREFLKRMAILAEICRHKLDEYQMELYDRELCSRGYDELCTTINKIIINRKSNERFPSIMEFKALIPHPSNFGFPTDPSAIHPSHNSIFSKEDIAEMFDMMRKRMMGLISCRQLEEYGQMIGRLVNEGKRK